MSKSMQVLFVGALVAFFFLPDSARAYWTFQLILNPAPAAHCTGEPFNPNFLPVCDHTTAWGVRIRTQEDPLVPAEIGPSCLAKVYCTSGQVLSCHTGVYYRSTLPGVCWAQTSATYADSVICKSDMFGSVRYNC